MTRLIATIEARMTSSRLPGKVLADVGGMPMLELMIERLRFVPELDGIVIATTINATDDPVAALSARLGVGLWRGSEHDVMVRVLDAAQHHSADVIVELTGDCPLIDPRIVSRIINEYRSAGVDYASTSIASTYPDGMDTQVFATSVLADAAERTSDPDDHEHVSMYIYNHAERYSLLNVTAPSELARRDLRLTLDTPKDLAVIRSVFEALRPNNREFPLKEIIAYLDRHPEIAALNRP